MIIVILVTHFPPIWLAGTELATYNIAKELAKMGHDVHVLTLWDNNLENKEIRDGFLIHRIRLHGSQLIPQIPIYLLKVLFTINNIKPNIIHAQAISLNASFAMIASKIFKKPYVVWAQGSDIYLTSQFFKNLVSRPVIKNASSVICLTKDMGKCTREIYERDISIIPNGISLEKLENLSREAARRELDLRNEDKIILFVGRLIPIKGVEYLINSMEYIDKQCKNIRLLLVGDGPEKKYLEDLVDKLNLGVDVQFIGTISNEIVAKYMAATDIFVLPSLSEGFPITILEALASGSPIITTRIRGLPEIIEDGENGFIVEPRDPVQLATKIMDLLNDRSLRHRIYLNNKLKAKDYSWKYIAKKLEESYYTGIIQYDQDNG